MVSGILGHEQFDTTRVYAIPSMEQMRNAMKEGIINGHDEEPEWSRQEDILAKYFGLRRNAQKQN